MNSKMKTESRNGGLWAVAARNFRGLLMVSGLVVWLLSWSCDGFAQGARPFGNADNVLGVTVPKIEKFVRVTADEGADVFKYARRDSPWRVIWTRDDEEDGEVQVDVTWSDRRVPAECQSEKSVEYRDDMLLLLGEEGDFWKVHIFTYYAPELEVGYIRKSDAELVAFQPLTADMVKAPNARKLSPTVVKTSGRYAGLVIDLGSDEEWGEEWLDVGVLADGMIVAPVSSAVTLIRDDDRADVEFYFDTESGTVLMYYPESKLVEDADGYGMWFDPAKLTDNQIAVMLQMLNRKAKDDRVRCECRIPGVDDSRLKVFLKP